MLPYVVLHNAVSLDGRIDWINIDMELFYGLIQGWNEEATLVGSETVISSINETPEQDDDAIEPPPKKADDPRPLLVIPDSRGRVQSWSCLRRQPYWRDIVVMCSHRTPEAYIERLQANDIGCILAGDDHVDYRSALEELNVRYRVKTVRVDSGGTLNGILLRAGLVDEVSVLFSPVLVGGSSPRTVYRAPDLVSGEGVIPLQLIHVENLKDDIVWLRYRVIRNPR